MTQGNLLVGDRHAEPGDQDATTEGTSVELTLEGLWVQRSTSPDEWNCGFVPARDLNRLLDREPFGS